MTEATATSAAGDAARTAHNNLKNTVRYDPLWVAFSKAAFKREAVVSIAGQPYRAGQLADRSIWLCVVPYGNTNASFECICIVEGDDYVRCSCGYQEGVVRYSCRHIRALWVKGFLRRSEIKPTWELNRRDRLAWEESPDA